MGFIKVWTDLTEFRRLLVIFEFIRMVWMKFEPICVGFGWINLRFRAIYVGMDELL